MVSLQVDVATLDEAEIDTLVRVVENRLDALGIGDAEVVRSDTAVRVRVPVEDEALVRSTVGSKPVSLEFRPVLSYLGEVVTAENRAQLQARVDELRVTLGVPDGVSAQQVLDSEQAARRTAGSSESNDDEISLNGYGVDLNELRFGELYGLERQLAANLTPLEALSPQEHVTLEGSNGKVYELGPVALDGDAIEGATASASSGEWLIELVFREGPSGIDLFNEIAAVCSAGDPSCPASVGGHGQLAVVVDGRVVSAPSINAESFERDQIQISGGFTEVEAKNLALALRLGPSDAVITFKD